jgi:DEAD/DEAH box helicase domain-containing protein
LIPCKHPAARKDPIAFDAYRLRQKRPQPANLTLIAKVDLVGTVVAYHSRTMPMFDEINVNLIRSTIEDSGYFIADRLSLPTRNPVFAPVPPRLHPDLRAILTSLFPGGLYQHQAKAIDAVLDGQDVCLGTSTASGKSLVFMAAAIDLFLRDSSVQVLALYPVRALIQDQMGKWRGLLEPLDITVGFIDGSVPMEERDRILETCRVVLMTPDVAHAWIMGHLGERLIQRFLRSVRMLVLDEAHVYDGVFGTNMAYFLRRLAKVTERLQVFCSTATIGQPGELMEKLTGRGVRVFGTRDDTSLCPEKTIFLCRTALGDPFENAVRLLSHLAKLDGRRFLAFGDSRKMVERIVAASSRFRNRAAYLDSDGSGDTDDECNRVDKWNAPDHPGSDEIFPYRAGYETADRNSIQKALSHGRLAGVVSTSALELGLDIGEIDIVVLLSSPPTVKSFHQRLGRAGRRRSAVCIVLDDQDSIPSLAKYLARPMEPGWLYLDNRYIQYTHVLCAAKEMASLGRTGPDGLTFDGLPPAFSGFLKNELEPRDIVPADLYLLKQRGAGDPHHEFPIRSTMEKEFKVSDEKGMAVGRLTLSQALREAYPGAIYYYMARPYRVYRFNYRLGEIKVHRVRHWATTPIAQSKVFPRFQGGILGLRRGENGFLAEVEMQVSERVLGFMELRGRTRTRHEYGPNSDYYQSPINRFFSTTGVCWHFSDRLVLSEAAAVAIRDAFCRVCGIQERDLGIGSFFSKEDPLGSAICQGWCIYDATNGSLRLTQMLAERITEVLDAAITGCDHSQDLNLRRDLVELARAVSCLGPTGEAPNAPEVDFGKDWVAVIAPGERALYSNGEGTHEVEVVQCRYTPHGPVYELKHRDPSCRWTVTASTISPIPGSTRMAWQNFVTGDTRL